MGNVLKSSIPSVGVSFAVLLSIFSSQVSHAAPDHRANYQSPIQLPLSSQEPLWKSWGHDSPNSKLGWPLLTATFDSEQEAKRTQANQLSKEALRLWRAHRWHEAIETLEYALILYRDIGDRQGEGTTLLGLGTITDNLNQYPQALDYYGQALAIYQDIGDRNGEGSTLNNMGLVYDSLGQHLQALEQYEQALAIFHDMGHRPGKGDTLNNIGAVYRNLGQYPQALAYFDQALDIFHTTGDRQDKGSTLGNVGAVYLDLGQYPQALTHFIQALAIFRDIGDRSSAGATLNNIGTVYDRLGQYPQALENYNQALTILRDIGDRRGEGSILNNIGGIYDHLGQYPQALETYDQALAILSDIGDRQAESVSLNNIGLVYSKLSQYPQALETYDQALAIFREIRDRKGEGVTLNNIGGVYNELGQYPQALETYDQALTIYREIGNLQSEGVTLNNIGWLLDITKEPELAIIFLKQSVNVYETIRDSNRAFTQEQQQSYTDTVANTYRKLADLLLQENRVLEAQAILDLLRTQELEDYFQDIRSSISSTNDVDYWKPEEKILTLYQQFIKNKTELTNLRTQDYNALSPDQRQRLSELQSQERTLTSNFNDFIERADVQADVAALRQATTGDIELDTLTDLQNNIAQLPDALVIYPLIFEDRLELILVPSDAPPIRRRIEVTSQDLNQAILDYRTILRTPTRLAQPAAQKLYNWLIADIEPDLEALGTKTIVYSPDGALRYIPLAALHDGNQWLAERFAITHITNKSQSDLGDNPTPNPRILAGACAACSYTHTVGDNPYSFQDLPFTRTEVTNLAEQLPNTDILLDQNFSKAETENRLGNYNIIHLATHGAFVSSSPDESFILFGDGNVATLREMRSWPLREADLVVLSACETGLGSQDLGNGIEVLGLGYQLERAGAKSAIASLWRVDDGGTQALMNAFYLALSNGLPKAEALRRAQLALIKDDLSVIAGESRTATSIFSGYTDKPMRLSASPDHPYYWAPFILIGNGL